MQYAHGFARFCNTKYNNDVEDIDNPFIHLTNVAIQKKDVRACPPSPLLSVPLRSLIPWLSLSLGVCVCVYLSVCLFAAHYRKLTTLHMEESGMCRTCVCTWSPPSAWR